MPDAPQPRGTADPASPPPDAVAAPPSPGGAVYLRPGHLYRAVTLAFLLALLFHFFTPLARALLLAYAAAILAVGLSAVTSRIPLNRKWVAALTGVTLLAGIVTLLWFGAPALVSQVRDLAGDLPRIQAQLREWGEWIYRQTGIRVPLLRGGAGAVQQVMPGVAGDEVLGRAAGLLEVVLLVLVVLVGGLYAMASPNERLLNPFLRAVPTATRPAVYRIFRLLGKRLVGWLRGTGIAMLAVGALSILAFYAIGVPNALALGLLNGLVEFIPIFGPWIGGATATLVAFIADPVKGAWVAVASLAIQQIEANLITPWAMSREAEVHPFVTLFALLLFGGLFGFLGLFLAVPLVIFFWTVIQVLWVERTIDTDRDRIAPVVRE